MTPNQKAFLDMIAYSEGTSYSKGSDNGYNVCVGGTTERPKLFSDYSKHPRIHDKATNSDAAGRYQLMGRYFDPYCKMLGLHDFSPDSQDKIALQQIKECHALGLIEAGKITEAISKCARIWASFPGANYGQHEQKINDLLVTYKKSGGTING